MQKEPITPLRDKTEKSLTHKHLGFVFRQGQRAGSVLLMLKSGEAV